MKGEGELQIHYSMLNRTFDYYAHRLAQLRIDRSHGRPAPHKPLLLLAVIELIERGIISRNEIEISPELVSAFLNYWGAVYPTQKGVLALPFFHLKSDGFWHFLPQEGFEKTLKTVRHIKSNYQLRDMVKYVFLDSELFNLLLSDNNRNMFRRIIVNNYFQQEEGKKLFQTINVSRDAMQYEQALIAEASSAGAVKAAKGLRITKKARAAGFRHAIMSLYNYTCSVCGLRIMTLEGSSAVEAAHIMPFNVSANDDLRNGMALCKLHHWSLDEGLLSVDENYCVLVSSLMKAARPTEWMLTDLSRKQLLLPRNAALHPAQEYLHYHRENIFLG